MVEAVGVNVIVCACPDVELEVLIYASTPPVPPLPVTVTVTEFAVVSNWKPDGAVRIIYPTGIPVLSVSVITGPVKVVNVPPVESADIAPPPVAVVTVAVAKAELATARSRPTINEEQTDDVFITFRGVFIFHGSGAKIVECGSGSWPARACVRQAMTDNRGAW